MIKLDLQFFGGRGSGSGMSGGGSGGGGLSTSALAKKVDKTGFTNEGGGQWTLDISGAGGGSILDESDSSAGGYGAMKAYSVTAWDANYQIIGEKQIFGSLNAAKDAVKRKIKSTL